MPRSPSTLTRQLRLWWRHHSEIWQSGLLRWCTQSLKWYSQCWRKAYQSQQRTKCASMCLRLKKNKKIPKKQPLVGFFFGVCVCWSFSSAAWMFFCRMWDERRSLRYCFHPLAPIGYAAVQSILTQLPCTQHLIHAVGPSAGRKREGEKQGESRSDRWSWKGWTCDKKRWSNCRCCWDEMWCSL